MIRAFTHTPPSRGERSLASQSLVVVGQRRLRRRVARVLSNRDGRRLRRRSAWVLADIVLGSWHISHPLAGTSPSAVSKNFLGPHPPAGTPALGAMRVGKADCLQPCCTQVQHPTRRTEGGQREREGESGQEEKTIARLTGEKTVRHDRVAVAAFLSSRRSSVNVVTRRRAARVLSNRRGRCRLRRRRSAWVLADVVLESWHIFTSHPPHHKRLIPASSHCRRTRELPRLSCILGDQDVPALASLPTLPVFSAP